MPTNQQRLPRRAFLNTAALAAAAACAPAAPTPVATSTGTATASWENEWDQLVDAAKAEGKLVLVTTVGAGFRDAVQAFEAAFPGISVEQTGLQASQFTPRFLQEYKAGIHSYDAMTTTWVIVPREMATAGAIRPIRELLFRPDILDDKAWRDGFGGGYLDVGDELCAPHPDPRQQRRPLPDRGTAAQRRSAA